MLSLTSLTGVELPCSLLCPLVPSSTNAWEWEGVVTVVKGTEKEAAFQNLASTELLGRA